MQSLHLQLEMVEELQGPLKEENQRKHCISCFPVGQICCLFCLPDWWRLTGWTAWPEMCSASFQLAIWRTQGCISCPFLKTSCRHFGNYWTWRPYVPSLIPSIKYRSSFWMLPIFHFPIARTVSSCPLYISSSYSAPFSPTLNSLGCPVSLHLFPLTLSFFLLSSQSFSPIPSHPSPICTLYYGLPGFFLPSDPHSSCASLLHHLLLHLCPLHPIALLWIQSRLAVSFPCTKLSVPSLSLSCASVPSLPLAASCSPSTPSPDTLLGEVPPPPATSQWV